MDNNCSFHNFIVENVKFETCLILQNSNVQIGFYWWFYKYGFRENNNLLNSCVTGLLRTSRRTFTSHIGVGSTEQKALDGRFANYAISLVKRDKCIHRGHAGLFYKWGTL